MNQISNPDSEVKYFIDFTYQELLNKECSYRDYYEQFATHAVRSKMLCQVNRDTLEKAWKSDKTFGSIVLEQWESIDISREISNMLREAGDSFSLENSVLILKETARLEIEGTLLDVGDIFNIYQDINGDLNLRLNERYLKNPELIEFTDFYQAAESILDSTEWKLLRADQIGLSGKDLLLCEYATWYNGHGFIKVGPSWVYPNKGLDPLVQLIKHGEIRFTMLDLG